MCRARPVVERDQSFPKVFNGVGEPDRVAVMMQGELVEVGPSQQVLRTPDHPYTQRLLAAVLTLG
jgi:ABC-type oligopeptide transport system ATPase subunit